MKDEDIKIVIEAFGRAVEAATKNLKGGPGSGPQGGGGDGDNTEKRDRFNKMLAKAKENVSLTKDNPLANHVWEMRVLEVEAEIEKLDKEDSKNKSKKK